MAGTMDSRRENSNKRGANARNVCCFWEEWGDGIGIVMEDARGESAERDDGAVRRAVGRFRGYKMFL